eukprot:1810691-Rhodomonas_salina.2
MLTMMMMMLTALRSTHVRRPLRLERRRIKDKEHARLVQTERRERVFGIDLAAARDTAKSNAFLVQVVLSVWCHAFDFAVHRPCGGFSGRQRRPRAAVTSAMSLVPPYPSSAQQGRTIIQKLSTKEKNSVHPCPRTAADWR